MPAPDLPGGGSLQDLDAVDAGVWKADQLQFEASRQAHEARIAVLRDHIAEAMGRIEAHEAEAATADIQGSIIDDERMATVFLLEKGLTPKPRLRAIERAAETLRGQATVARRNAGVARQQVAGAESDLRRLSAERSEAASDQFRRTIVELAEVEVKIKAVEERLVRSDIRAPASGTVVGLKVFTEQGVIRPAETVLEIVPDDVPVTVEAYFDVNRAANIRTGLVAEVGLTAFPSRTTPPIQAIVRDVSADRLTHQQTGEPFYLVKLGIRASEPFGARLVAGMAAEVTIPTRDRTVLQYLLEPLERSLHRSMRES